MNCSARAEKLLLMQHGALGAMEKLGMQWHLLTCPACRASSRRLGRASAALRAAVGPGPRHGISAPAAAAVILLVMLAVTVTMGVNHVGPLAQSMGWPHTEHCAPVQPIPPFAASMNSRAHTGPCPHGPRCK